MQTEVNVDRVYALTCAAEASWAGAAVACRFIPSRLPLGSNEEFRAMCGNEVLVKAGGWSFLARAPWQFIEVRAYPKNELMAED
jgi:hypothetical protein